MSKEFTTEERSIKIVFNKNETHRLELNTVNGQDIIIAIESLKNKVEKASGMPYAMALIMAAKLDEENEKAKEKEEQA